MFFETAGGPSMTSPYHIHCRSSHRQSLQEWHPGTDLDRLVAALSSSEGPDLDRPGSLLRLQPR